MDRTSPEEYDDRLSEIESGDDDVALKIEDAQTSPSTTSKPNGVKTPAHLQKRRRVTRACDECRRKKIKCDGKQPCTHCTVYSYGKRKVSHCYEPQAETIQLQSAHTISPRTEGETRHRNTSKISSTECTEQRLFCTS